MPYRKYNARDMTKYFIPRGLLGGVLLVIICIFDIKSSPHFFECQTAFSAVCRSNPSIYPI